MIRANIAGKNFQPIFKFSRAALVFGQNTIFL